MINLWSDYTPCNSSQSCCSSPEITWQHLGLVAVPALLGPRVSDLGSDIKIITLTVIILTSSNSAIFPVTANQVFYSFNLFQLIINRILKKHHKTKPLISQHRSKPEILTDPLSATKITYWHLRNRDYTCVCVRHRLSEGCVGSCIDSVPIIPVLSNLCSQFPEPLLIPIPCCD